jgi:hypothetical protein
VRITELSHPVQAGFPIIAALAGRYGIDVRVDGRSSPFGGAHATVLIPAELTAIIATADTAVPGTPPADGVCGVPGRRADGLPQRHRRPAPSVPAGGTEVEPSAAPPVSARALSRSVNGFVRGTRTTIRFGNER